MKDNQFRELLKIVQGKDVYDVHADEVKEILGELWVGEFKEIEEKKISIDLRKRLGDRSLADVKVKDGKVIIWINPKNWENNPNFTKGGALRSLLRHELLHVAINDTDDSPFFKMVARQKGVDIWNV